jgi:pyrimidine-nucleoside phosphorylase
MLPQDFIAKKKYGGTHTREEIEWFIKGYVDGDIPDYQVSAWLMAVWFNGMTYQETADLTYVMMHSGDLVDLSDIDGIKVDKHSSGGVGDKTTFVVGPILAALGYKVAKMSGRGLGHTGGTLDKLESIPGLNVYLPMDQFKDIVRKVGMAVVGQTANLVPADGKLYALRDVTATVDSIPLIASSIMSKKLAVGTDLVSLDVKVGKGAFMKTLEDARELAKTMVELGKALGRDTIAHLTNMDQPLGVAVGNSIEVAEAIQTLKGEGPEDFTALCVGLAASTMHHLGHASSYEEAEEKVWEVIRSGKALEIFGAMIEAQGGDKKVIDDPWSVMKRADKVYEYKADRDGYIAGVDAYKVGMAVVDLGGGRVKKSDPIDHSVGIYVDGKIGDKVAKGDVLMRIHYTDEAKLQEALKRLEGVYEIVDTPVQKPPVIYEHIE